MDWLIANLPKQLRWPVAVLVLLIASAAGAYTGAVARLNDMIERTAKAEVAPLQMDFAVYRAGADVERRQIVEAIRELKNEQAETNRQLLVILQRR